MIDHSTLHCSRIFLPPFAQMRFWLNAPTSVVNDDDLERKEFEDCGNLLDSFVMPLLLIFE